VILHCPFVCYLNIMKKLLSTFRYYTRLTSYGRDQFERIQAMTDIEKYEYRHLVTNKKIENTNNVMTTVRIIMSDVQFKNCFNLYDGMEVQTSPRNAPATFSYGDHDERKSFNGTILKAIIRNDLLYEDFLFGFRMITSKEYKTNFPNFNKCLFKITHENLNRYFDTMGIIVRTNYGKPIEQNKLGRYVDMEFWKLDRISMALGLAMLSGYELDIELDKILTFNDQDFETMFFDIKEYIEINSAIIGMYN